MREKAMTIQELLDKKGSLANQANEILKAAAEDGNRDLRSDEETRFDAIHADSEAINKQVSRLAKQAAVEESLDASKGRRSEPNHSATSRTISTTTQSAGRPSANDQDMAIRGWLLSGAEDAAPTAEHREAGRRCGININSRQITLHLTPKPLRSLAPADVEAWEKRAAMGVGSTTIGGFTVADSPMGALEKALLSFGGMRQVATVLRTASGSDLPIPTNNDTSNTGRLLNENTQVTETDLTVGQLVLQAYKFSSDAVLVSVEFLQDSSLDVPSFIGTALGERIGRSQINYFTTGTGSSQPNGVVTAATSSSVTSSAATACTYDNLLDVIHSVDPSYRVNGQWLLHDSALKMIKKVKVLQYSGDTVGAPLWVPGVNGLGDTILGYPYTINQSLATVATTTKSVLFGDFSKYIIRDCREVTLVRLDERYADYHQVGFLAFARSDGDLLDAGTHPVKYMTQA